MHGIGAEIVPTRHLLITKRGTASLLLENFAMNAERKPRKEVADNRRQPLRAPVRGTVVSSLKLFYHSLSLLDVVYI